MSTWVEISKLKTPSEAVLFAQEMVLTNNIDMVNALCLDINNNPFNFVCPKMETILRHKKKAVIEKLNSYPEKDVAFVYNVYRAFYTSYKMAMKKKYGFIELFSLVLTGSETFHYSRHKGYIDNNGVNVFSSGCYIVNDGKWYKLLTPTYVGPDKITISRQKTINVKLNLSR